MFSEFCGWRPSPNDTDAFAKTQAIPVFMGGTPRGTDPVLLYEIYRKVAGQDDLGAQGIGDCVSWGYKHLSDFAQAVEIYRDINLANQAEKKLYTFEMSSSEAIYGLARCEIGGWWNSYSDGLVGAYAAQAIQKYGTISYKELGRKGLGDQYDARRAKTWGAKGLPDELEPTAFLHRLENISLVRNFNDAAALIESGYGIAICSDYGFENGSGGRTRRDQQGFATPRGRWPHCMFLSAVRYDRPGMCCINQWPLGAFEGPLDLNQPKNSFWIDEKHVNGILSSGESWTASKYKGYPMLPLTFKF